MAPTTKATNETMAAKSWLRSEDTAGVGNAAGDPDPEADEGVDVEAGGDQEKLGMELADEVVEAGEEYQGTRLIVADKE